MYEEEDIVPGLLELIESEFDERTYNSEKLKNALKLLKNKQANYKTANEFAIEIGEILSDVLNVHVTSEVLPGGKMHFNIADRVMNVTLKKNHELIASFAKDVQTELNHQAGLKLKGQKAPLNQDRIDGLVDKLSNADSFEDVKWLLDEPIINFSQSIIDSTVKENVEFHAKAGLKPKINRVARFECCEWCQRLQGIYDYKNAPDDVYKRHRRCRCNVEYDPQKGKVQDVWSKQWIDPMAETKKILRQSLNSKK
ncbi:hypothetical protein [Vagococcus xieshaowenii]|uniref:Uncharacterized protein n=1 Tax=Vagococcus xieshaowenii TaxID=2562451 RepID=A0AAJ5EET6_9ENTE|nr:hypothetical protein [Vagococcus xieshaowenii]QCA28246.1 hypothetical protein E4Z98_02540 [Vagococcus xieshaowenii]TFZ41900.1 hypothetical protein E4031_04720 [Vagococcus xieshaowenii]